MKHILHANLSIHNLPQTGDFGRLQRTRGPEEEHGRQECRDQHLGHGHGELQERPAGEFTSWSHFQAGHKD